MAGIDQWPPPEPTDEELWPTAVGCSIYAGGHAVGVAQQKFRILAHLEEGDFGVPTFRANFPHVPVYYPHGEWPTWALRGKVDWLYSNPPCAPWSQAGRTMQRGKDGWRDDPRVDHTLHSFDLISKLQPRVWSWESVQRTYTVGADIVDDLTRRALDLGYSVTHFLTDGQLHGLPQRRQRFFFLAHRVRFQWPVPEIPGITVAEALAGVEPDWVAPMPQDWQAVASVLAPGAYLRARWEELHEVKAEPGSRVAGRPPYTVHRIRGDQVCSTITSMHSQIHHSENRYLSNSEVARLQGYPRGFVWVGPPGTHQNQMAKAVTPAVARYLAGVVRRGLTRNIPTVGQVEVVDFRPNVTRDRAHLNRALLK